MAGVDRRTAKKAWEVGLHYPWAEKPIAQVIEEERKLARAMLGGAAVAAGGGAAPAPAPAGQTPATGGAPAGQPVPMRADPTAAAARNDSAAALAQEAMMVRGARGNVMSLMAMTTRMLRTVTPIWERWCTELTKDPEKANPELLLRIFRSLTMNSREQIAAGQLVMEMERAKLGDPEADEKNLPLDQAAEQITRAAIALQKAQAMGLSVVTGGAGQPGTEPVPSDKA